MIKIKKLFNPYFEDRTDVLYYSSLNDIINSLTIATLLFHASYLLKDLIYKEYGQDFIDEFKKNFRKIR